jgi:hypothetical protein
LFAALVPVIVNFHAIDFHVALFKINHTISLLPYLAFSLLVGTEIIG